jgi:hypothetical protein
MQLPSQPMNFNQPMPTAMGEYNNGFGNGFGDNGYANGFGGEYPLQGGHPLQQGFA